MTVGAIGADEALSFLSKYEETAQFLINNLREHGSFLGPHHNSGNFKAIRGDDGAVEGVFCLTRRGNLIAQANGDFSAEILDACSREPVALRGFIGDWTTLEPIIKLFKERNPDYTPTYESKEILYSYLLGLGDPFVQHDPRVRIVTPGDVAQWVKATDEYNAELSLPDELSIDEKQRDFHRLVRTRTAWGLFEGDTLLSRAALNSRGEKIGQVGGVFTSPTHRQQGLARATMFHMLKDCRDIHGHTKNILFTGLNDLAAQKLYESMGYSRIGYFALMLS